MTPLDKIIFIRRIKGLPHAQKVILLVLATHLGNNEYAYPSLTTLQEECGLARDKITSNIRKLINIGYLKKLPPNLPLIKSNRYLINFNFIEQLRNATSSQELLVAESYQSSSLELPVQVRSATSLVAERYPKRNIKEIKRNLEEKDNVHSHTVHSSKKRFEDFWAIYPRHENKKRASEVWQRKKLDDKADLVIADVNQRKERHQSWKNGYIPHASTYLNGERWNDDITEVSNGNGASNNQSNGQQPGRRKSNSEHTWDFMFNRLRELGAESPSNAEIDLPAEIPKCLPDH